MSAPWLWIAPAGARPARSAPRRIVRSSSADGSRPGMTSKPRSPGRAPITVAPAPRAGDAQDAAGPVSRSPDSLPSSSGTARRRLDLEPAGAEHDRVGLGRRAGNAVERWQRLSRVEAGREDGLTQGAGPVVRDPSAVVVTGIVAAWAAAGGQEQGSEGEQEPQGRDMSAATLRRFRPGGQPPSVEAHADAAQRTIRKALEVRAAAAGRRPRQPGHEAVGPERERLAPQAAGEAEAVLAGDALVGEAALEAQRAHAAAGAGPGGGGPHAAPAHPSSGGRLGDREGDPGGAVEGVAHGGADRPALLEGLGQRPDAAACPGGPEGGRAQAQAREAARPGGRGGGARRGRDPRRGRLHLDRARVAAAEPRPRQAALVRRRAGGAGQGVDGRATGAGQQRQGGPAVGAQRPEARVAVQARAGAAGVAGQGDVAQRAGGHGLTGRRGVGQDGGLDADVVEAVGVLGEGVGPARNCRRRWSTRRSRSRLTRRRQPRCGRPWPAPRCRP